MSPGGGDGGTSLRMLRPQILFLDAYDSFTNNIVSLLETLLDADVHVLPIDSPLVDQHSPSFREDLLRELAHYHAVVCGPGPGSPEHERDVGLMRWVWELEECEGLLPVLGVCLGFQSLVLASGGKVRRLRRGLHGMVREIDHHKTSSTSSSSSTAVTGREGDIFHGVGNFKATLYHSLCADVGQDTIREEEWDEKRWATAPGTPDLLPLAWSVEDREDGAERILMAVKHRTKPFWGLQYHPESICTHSAGHAVIKKWFARAMRWNEDAGRQIRTGESFLARNSIKPSLLSPHAAPSHWNGTSSANGTPAADSEREPATPLSSREQSSQSLLGTVGLDCDYHCKTIPLPSGVQVPHIVEVLRSAEAESEYIILDSANADKLTPGTTDVRGRFSIIALGVEECLRIEYHARERFATVRIPRTNGITVDHKETVPFAEHESIWHFLAGFLEKRRIQLDGSEADTPFKGGFMGFVTYEMGLDGIGVSPQGDRGHHRPDLCFAWITKSIVLDHVRGLVHVQHLQKRKLNASFWIDSTINTLRASKGWQNESFHNGQNGSGGVARAGGTIAGLLSSISAPRPDEYEDKVKECQDYIAAGESYELCLTDQTTITLNLGPYLNKSASQSIERHPNGYGNGISNGNGVHTLSQPDTGAGTMAWDLYRTLRTRQPAPFGSFIRLGGATLISSSPERFLEYSSDGLCSMRPMKGTVRKSAAVSTLPQAEKILHVPKEEAENLMIVDLVRHDLHGVCGSGNVTVSHLMKVEEYASVFQMITVVEGRLPPPHPDKEKKKGIKKDDEDGDAEITPARYTGLDVLAASLPPGSMTGAPKKRSCELLQEIEGHRERSLYSGVVGYMDVTGRGDWSVTIRTMFRWDDESEPSPGDGENETGEAEAATSALKWRIGAGGAVTILSTPEGEREEMFTKLAGPLGIFSREA